MFGSTDEDQEFRVYTHYVKGLSDIIASCYPCYKQINLLQDQGIPVCGQFELDKVRKYLFNSWNTETILCYPNDQPNNDSFIKYANHWSPVLGYYSIFLAFQALLLLHEGRECLEHENFLEKISSYTAKNKIPTLFPFDKYCGGCTYYNEEYYNFDVNKTLINEFQMLSSPYCLDENVFVAKLLKTTRKKKKNTGRKRKNLNAVKIKKLMITIYVFI